MFVFVCACVTALFWRRGTLVPNLITLERERDRGRGRERKRGREKKRGREGERKRQCDAEAVGLDEIIFN